MRGLFYAGLVFFSLLVTLQSAHALYLTLYTWNRPPAEARAPGHFLPPRLSFTVMLPARHEEAVIAATIERVVRARYPSNLIQVLVVCSADDEGTIAQAEEKIRELRREGYGNVSVVVFDDRPINKPHGLNTGLHSTQNEIVTIFDAEDDIHPDIFNVVNTLMLEDPPVQGDSMRRAVDELRIPLVFDAQRAGVLLLVQEPPALPRAQRVDHAGRQHRLLLPALFWSALTAGMNIT